MIEDRDRNGHDGGPADTAHAGLGILALGARPSRQRTRTTERGITIHPISSFGSATDTVLLDQISRQAENGKLMLRVGDVLPASQAAEAHRRLAAGGVRGRIVLDFASPQW